MPPHIALLIFLVFIICFFILDAKRKVDVSRCLWIPTIWLMIAGSRMISLWFHDNSSSRTVDTYVEGSPVDRVFFITLIFLGILALSNRKIDWPNLIKGNKFIIMFFIYSALSIIWSDFTWTSLKRYIKEIGNIIMVLIILTDRYPIDAINTLLRRCAFLLIPLSIILIKYYSHLGRTYNRWTGDLQVIGVTTTKNSLGVLSMVVALYFFWKLSSLLRKNKFSISFSEALSYIALITTALWLLFISKSATSLFCFIIGLCILLVSGRPIIRRNIRFLGTFIIILIVITLFSQYVFNTSNILISQLGRDETLTGRTDIWKQAINAVETPLTGVGYDSFWLGNRMTQFWSTYWWGPIQSHNGYVETYLNLGYIGIILLVGILISTYRKIKQELLFNYEYGILRLTFLVVALLYNITESAFIGLNIISFIFLLIAVATINHSFVKNQSNSTDRYFRLSLPDNAISEANKR